MVHVDMTVHKWIEDTREHLSENISFQNFDSPALCSSHSQVSQHDDDTESIADHITISEVFHHRRRSRAYFSIFHLFSHSSMNTSASERQAKSRASGKIEVFIFIIILNIRSVGWRDMQQILCTKCEKTKTNTFKFSAIFAYVLCSILWISISIHVSHIRQTENAEENQRKAAKISSNDRREEWRRKCI